jgi:hypothetical protein
MSATGEDFRPVLDAALAGGLPVKITERVVGRRYRYEHHYPAKRIDGFREGRGGAVVVLETFTRIRVRNIAAVEVCTDEGRMA